MPFSLPTRSDECLKYGFLTHISWLLSVQLEDCLASSTSTQLHIHVGKLFTRIWKDTFQNESTAGVIAPRILYQVDIPSTWNIGSHVFACLTGPMTKGHA